MFKQEPSLDALLNRTRPSFWSLFIKAPFSTLAKALHRIQQTVLSQSVYAQTTTESIPITVVCVSDTHNSQPQIPPGDLFIHAGDLSQGGTANEIQRALDWIDALPHQHKIVIAGNHDMYLDSKCRRTDDDQPSTLNWGSTIYLEDNSTVLRFKDGRSLKVYGTPHTRKHGSWGFQFPCGTDVFSNTVPEDTDILVSHSPPRFHLDVDGWGDGNLLRELWRVKPALHVFGHIHEGYGKEILTYDAFQNHYEKICNHSGSYINVWYLLKMSYIYLTSRRLRGSSRQRFTVAVNPSAVGGLRDTVRRQPIIVTI